TEKHVAMSNGGRSTQESKNSDRNKESHRDTSERKHHSNGKHRSFEKSRAKDILVTAGSPLKPRNELKTMDSIDGACGASFADALGIVDKADVKANVAKKKTVLPKANGFDLLVEERSGLKASKISKSKFE